MLHMPSSTLSRCCRFVRSTTFWISVAVVIVLLAATFVIFKSKVFDSFFGDEETSKQIDYEGQPFDGKDEDEQKDKDNAKDFTSVGETEPFTSSQLEEASSALSSGITIEDPESDWFQFEEGSTEPDGSLNNSDPYPLNWTDLRSVSVGADEEYLYVKIRFWGRFPDEPVTYNGDTITGGCGKINSFSFTNEEGQQDTADLISNINFAQMSNGEILGVDLIAMISPSGRNEDLETIFTIYSNEGLIAGGRGTDYILSAFPLDQFNLELGDTVTFDSTTEFGSEVYHHESIDILFSRENSKFGETIQYVLGSSEYSIVPSVDEENRS